MIRRINYKINIDQEKTCFKWKNLLKDVPCFVLGNGPSISKCPVSKLKNYFTIGINKAYLLIDPSILFWQDIEFFYTNRQNICKTKAIKYSTSYADPLGKYYHYKIDGNNYELPTKEGILHGRGSSGPLAFEIAWFLGCNPIILIGMDCKYIGEKTDFYGKNTFHKQHTLPNCVRGLEWIRKCNHERKIINCSGNDIFPEQFSLDDAINMANPDKYINGQNEIIKLLLSRK